MLALRPRDDGARLAPSMARATTTGRVARLASEPRPYCWTLAPELFNNPRRRDVANMESEGGVADYQTAKSD